MEIPQKILEAIREHEHFVLMTHVQPDGDAIGSLLALADILKRMGKRVFAYIDEPISHLYEFFPDIGRTDSNFDNLQQFISEAGTDLCAIALDCGEAERIGRRKNQMLTIHPFLVIDHHLSHSNFGDYRWVDPKRSSTGEMVYEICTALGETPSFNGAFSIYVAIATDTGSFRYECTGARTFEIMARLVEIGIKPDYVSGFIYDNYSAQRLRLMELVLGTLDVCEDDHLAFIHVTREMLHRSGAVAQDVEGFIEYPRSIRSVKVAAFLKETKNDVVSVSLRAKGECNVAQIAKKFGGGGHRNAAGCRFPSETIDSVRKKLQPALRNGLDTHV